MGFLSGLFGGGDGGDSGINWNTTPLGGDSGSFGGDSGSSAGSDSTINGILGALGGGGGNSGGPSISNLLTSAGGLAGSIGQMLSQNKLSSAIGGASQAQQQANQQAIDNALGLTGIFQNNYAPAAAPTGAAYTQLAAGAGSQTNALAQQLINMGMNPSVVASITGINANQLGQQATSYLSNPAASPLGQAYGGLQGYYQNEQQNGINPQFATNAQNQLQQNFQQSLNDLQSHAAPGQNLAGMQQQAQNSLLSNSANLAGNLAGQSQQYSQQGAQGLENLASLFGQQSATNMQNAATLGSNINQTQLVNAAGAQGTAANSLSSLLPFLTQGYGAQEGATNTLTGIGTQYGNLASNLFNATQKSAGSGGGGGGGFGNILGSVLGAAGSIFGF